MQLMGNGYEPQVASGGADKSIRIWDTEKAQQLAALEGHQGAISCIAYSPGGGSIASCSADK